jgi:hypothetical protein
VKNCQGDVADLDGSAVGVFEVDAEHLLDDEDAKGRMENGAVPHVGHGRLARVNEVVDREVVLDLSAVLLDAVSCVSVGLHCPRQ